VVGAALLAQTVLNLHARPLGFDQGRLLSIGALWSSAPADPSQRIADVDFALDRLAAVPGVAAAAATSALPFAGQNSGNVFVIEGQRDAGGPPPDTDYRVVSSAYFDALGIPLQRGRVFEGTDRTAGIVVISQTAAARYWPGRDPIGSRLKLGASEWLTVAGVVADVRYGGLNDPDERVRPMMYLPYWQMPDTPVSFVARTTLAPPAIADAVRLALADARGWRVGRLESVTAMVREASASQRFSMSLVSAFAGCAVLLAAVGLYGLLALVVGRRTREFALRCAVGATPWDLLRTMTRFVLALAAVGIGLGVAISMSLSQAVRAVLYGISPNDLRTYALVAAGFAVLSLAASVVPIRRALRVDVLRAMQTE
jgi:predicted permease